MKCFMFFLVNFIFIILASQAQTLDEAKKLYAEGNFSAALPAFETAYKSSPQNVSYNLWYGICLAETGKKTEAIALLKFAASKNQPDASLYLGKLYYALYEFEESLAAYEQGEQLLIKNKRQAETDALKPLIERSARAARMLSRCEDVQIIDSIIVNKADFLKAYFISREAGYLESTGKGVIYENPLHDKRYFAQKTKNEKSRIFNEIKLKDNWTEEKELAIPSDSLGDDNYPFVLQDGMTIYYASTGNGSIGGYDLFITRYNANNDSYLAPAQLGMPFNSIADDYLMVIDENNNIGYFASNRFQKEGKVIIYTFIPNEEIKSIQTDNNTDLINRAKISSIHDTWKQDVDYQTYINDVKNNILEEQNKKKKDFVFVVNDEIVYYTLNDFKNVAAKQAFLKTQELENQIKEQERDLEDLRTAYVRGDNKYKQSVQSTILYRERRLPELWEDYSKALINVRNLEIKYLGKNYKL